MKRYALTHTDITASRLVYGCMALGRQWGEIDIPEARAKTAAIIDVALEEGINFFDHADIYADGRSEELFGDVLRANPSLRDQMYLQSKCGVRFEGSPEATSPGRYDFSYAHIVQSAEGSLKRLGVEQLDILLLHRPDPLMEPDEVARAFDALRQSGKVRYFGVSNFSAGQMALLQRSCSEPLVANQLQLSLMHHHLINEIVSFNQTGYEFVAHAGVLDYCQAHGVRVQPWTPLERGRMFTPPADASPALLAVAEKVATMADAHNTTREAVVLSWLLRHPVGFQPVVGTTNGQRLRDCCRADDFAMSREDWYTLFNTARGKPVP